MKETVEKTCKHCNKTFKTAINKKLFCNSTCRFKYWEVRNPRLKSVTIKPGN